VTHSARHASWDHASAWPRIFDAGPRELILVGLTSIAFGVLIVLVASGLTPVYLSPDGAHAITDARGLLGLAPRPPYYLPGYPLVLIPLDRLGVDPTINVAVSLAVLCGLLFASLYWLARGAATARAAFFGSLIGTGSTSLGELMGWQGSATLLAIVALTASLAAMQRWSRRRGWPDALLVGACYGVTLASHPFVAAFGGLVLATLWGYYVAQGRRFTIRGFGPGSLAGVDVAAAVPIVVMLAITTNYLAIDSPVGSSLRPPDLLAPVNVFGWMTRESPALSVLTLVVVGAALAKPGPGRWIGACTVATFVLLPAILSGDDSYLTRVAYLVPPTLALGGAALWEVVDRRLLATQQPVGNRAAARIMAAAPLLAGLWVISIGFPHRLLASVPYYSSLERDDYALIQALGNQAGAVATGWTGNQYWDGITNAWLVEGIANRSAMGPADPALSTRSVQRQQSAAAWRLFSGAAGVENGALQVSFGPANWRADPAIAARIGDYYIPFLFISDTANTYGVAAVGDETVSWTPDDEGATGRRTDELGAPIFEAAVRLAVNRVRVTWTRPPQSAAEPWTIWVWPAYGLPWRDVRADATSVELGPYSTVAYRDAEAFDALRPRVRLQVFGGASLEYVSSDARYGLPAVAIHVPPDADPELVVDVMGTKPADTFVAYDERDLITRFGVRTSLVWRDSGWVDRFSASPCFAPGRSNARLVTFEVSPECVTAGP
jgi:hypothetical protein